MHRLPVSSRLLGCFEARAGGHEQQVLVHSNRRRGGAKRCAAAAQAGSAPTHLRSSLGQLPSFEARAAGPRLIYST